MPARPAAQSRSRAVVGGKAAPNTKLRLLQEVSRRHVRCPPASACQPSFFVSLGIQRRRPCSLCSTRTWSSNQGLLQEDSNKGEASRLTSADLDREISLPPAFAIEGDETLGALLFSERLHRRSWISDAMVVISRNPWHRAEAEAEVSVHLVLWPRP